MCKVPTFLFRANSAWSMSNTKDDRTLKLLATRRISYSKNITIAVYRESYIELLIVDYPAASANFGSECNGL